MTAISVPQGDQGKVMPNNKKNTQKRTATATQHVRTYKALRPQKMGTEIRNPGDLVPEAATWLRVDNHVHMGYLSEVEVTLTTYAAAVQQYCPDLAERLAWLVHVDVAELTGESNG